MKIILAFATGLYSGYLPAAPGTWGSLAAIPLFLVLARLSLQSYLLFLLFFIIIAILIAGSAEKIIDQKDPGVIVIDEIAGMLVTLAGSSASWTNLLAGFLLFRFFDVLKPYPIKLIDQRVNGGTGIVLDDLIAGLYSLIVLQTGAALIGRYFG